MARTLAATNQPVDSTETTNEREQQCKSNHSDPKS